MNGAGDTKKDGAQTSHGEAALQFNMKDSSDPKKQTNKRFVAAIVVLSLATVGLLIGVIVLAVQANNNNNQDLSSTTTISSTTTTSANSTPTSATTTTTQPPTTTPPYSPEELRRIDCYPEALENPDQFPVDADKCTARGCEFDASPTSGSPQCYVSPDSGPGLGYSQGTVEKDDDEGMRVRLSPRQPSSRMKRQTGDVIFEVFYYGENKLRFKVRFYIRHKYIFHHSNKQNTS